MQGTKIVSQEEANKIFFRLIDMGLPGTKDQIWATFSTEKFNEERTVDRLLNQQFAQPAYTRPESAAPKQQPT